MTAPHFFPSPGIKLFGDSDHAECLAGWLASLIGNVYTLIGLK